ncbi:MATE family efflux transporter [Clostridium niameyense]|uniref:Multidrug export protein MepA n=1 Tax=Clostridium niameyense TaxID=1622073 RepID=A0A6M0R9L1_9CLOT|nr:MATE family efflux transporter [Clostridium niameyense]NEZ46932.1 MATE family efflux transporter [Clostridium niameyense]
MDRQKQLETEKVQKLLIKFSIPAITGMLVNAFYNIIDRAYIGHIKGVGSLAITGVGLTLPIMTIIMAFGMLIGLGAAAIISIKLGQHKKEDAEKILGNAFILLCIIMILITIIGLMFINPILRSFGSSEVTFNFAKEYITIILLGSITNALGFGLNNCIRAEGNPKMAMVTMLLGAILNLILDPIFIFTLNMGIKGAAIATVISQTANTIWVLRYFTGSRSSLKLKKENFKLEKKIFLEIISIGMAPFAVQLAASVVTVVSNNALKATGGDLAIGAMTIVNSVSLVFLMPIFGINQGAQPIIGYNYGAKQYKRVKETLIIAICSATVIVTLGFCIIRIFPTYIIRIFNGDAEMIKVGTNGLKTFLCMLPIIGFQIVSSNYFQAIGKAKIAVVLSLLRQVIILIPMLLILPKIFGLNGVWMSAPVADLVSSIVTAVFLLREMKKLDKAHNAREK